jgi:hypothetical protein
MHEKAQYPKSITSDKIFGWDKAQYPKHEMFKNPKSCYLKKRFWTKKPDRIRNGLMKGYHSIEVYNITTDIQFLSNCTYLYGKERWLRKLSS